jgi:hypothetical protein
MAREKLGLPEKLNDYWIDWMRAQFANEPDLPPKRIEQQAKEQAETWPEEEEEEPRPGKPPALRTIYKYMGEFGGLAEGVRKGYQPFSWPESMEEGLLPWEATAATIQLLIWTQEHGLWPPPVSLVQWFWRITLAIPDAPLGERLRVTATVASYREAGQIVPEDVVQLLVSPALRKEHRSHVIRGGPTAAWSTQFIWNRSARDELYATPQCDTTALC